MLDGLVVDDLTQRFLGLAVDRERSGEVYETLRGFFHDARNRLNSIKIGLYLAKRGGTESQALVWSELDASYQGLETLIERLQSLCRPAELSVVRGDLGPWLEGRRPHWEQILSERRKTLEWVAPCSMSEGQFDPSRLVQALDALVAWRANSGTVGGLHRLAWWERDGNLVIEWVEDRPGLTEPVEGWEGRSVSMALPLLAQVVDAQGGSLSVSKANGLNIRLTWPVESGRIPPS